MRPPARPPPAQASGSEALRTLLSLNAAAPPGGGKPRLHLRGLSPQTAGVALRFLYTGTAQLDAGNTVDVLLAGERLGLTALRGLAEAHLPRALREANVVAVLVAATA